MSIDETTFNAALDRHRRELHVHCYRMLGSFDEAEDALQDAFLRAWKARESFAGGEGLRAWLYKIATNVCLDSLRAKKRRAPSQGEIPWLQPYPDRLLDEVAPTEEEPDAVVVARETIELTYIAVIQLLPARQRAVLVLRDVLEWSAAETAEILDLSVAGRQQRAAACPGDAERAAAAARRRARRAQRRRAAAPAGLHRHARERRLVGRGGAHARGHPRVDAADHGGATTAAKRCGR